MKTIPLILEQLAQGLAALSWQIALLALLILAASSMLSKARPMVRYVLWCAVLARLCLPWTFHSPIALAGLAGYTRGMVAAPPGSVRIASDAPRAAAGGLHDSIQTMSSHSPGIARSEPSSGFDKESQRGLRTTQRAWQMTPWTLCGALWLIGIAAFATIALSRWARLRRIVERSEPCERPELITLLDQMRRRFHFKREISLHLLPQGAETLGPCATGVLRPAILLPSSLAMDWDLPAIEPILLHEFAHIRRGDVLVNGLQVLTQILYWFHPLVWFAQSRLRRERELICDDFAVLHTGGSAQRYGATVIRALEKIRTADGRLFASVGMAESSLSIRLRRLLDRAYSNPRPLSRGLLAALVFAGLLGVLAASDTLPKNPATANDRSAATASAQPEPAKAPAAVVPVEDNAAIPDFIARALRKAQDPEDPRAIPVAAGDPKGELSGKVVDHDGKPLAGVLVHAWDWCPGNETRTGADGAFRLTKLDPGERVEIRFIKSGFAPYTIIKQPLGAMTEPVTLDDRTCFEGVVTAPDGAPVPNAFIRANQGPKQADGVFITTIWTETHSDAQGRYRLLVQDESYDIQVTSPSGLVSRLPKVTIASGRATPLDIPLVEGVVFRARVVDSQTGEGVPDVKLGHWDHKGVEGTTNAQGELEIHGLIPGPFEFDVTAKGYARWWSEECKNAWQRREIKEGRLQRNFDSLGYDLSPGMQAVTITLEKAVRVRGRILDPDGNPVEGATAAPARTGSGNSLTGDTRFSVKTKADGSFETFLPASNEVEYNLIAHDGGYQQWRKWANGVSEPFKTTPGQEIEGLELKLSRPATVHGRVLDAGGKPVANREVRAFATDLRDNRYYVPTFRTDADGSFTIKFIRPGKHQIQVAPFWLDPREAPPGSSQDAEIAEGQTLNVPDFTALEPK